MRKIKNIITENKIYSHRNGDIVKDKIYDRSIDFNRDDFKNLVRKLYSPTWHKKRNIYLPAIRLKLIEKVRKNLCTIDDIEEFSNELFKKRKSSEIPEKININTDNSLSINELEILFKL